MQNSSLLSALLLIPVCSMGQVSVGIYETAWSPGSDNLAGTVVNLETVGMYSDIQFEVRLWTGAQVVNIMRKVIVDLPGTEDKFCWGSGVSSVCYDFPMVSPFDEFVSTNDCFVDDGLYSGVLYTVHKSNGIPGTAHYRYVVIDTAGNALDSVDVVHTSTVGEIEHSAKGISVWINALNTTLNVSGVTEELKLDIFDLSGQLVFSEWLDQARVNSFDMSYLPSGCYSHRITSGTVVRSGKFVL